jgi:hypothetical protein
MRKESFERATRSVRCLPFRKRFYEETGNQAMSSKDLCSRIDWGNYVFSPFGVDRAEAHFRWMIKIGVLRREVDGQGLTDRVRVTPLGTEVINQWEKEIPRAGLRERIRENFRRHTAIG